jgi:hypothetical protein
MVLKLGHIGKNVERTVKINVVLEKGGGDQLD